MKNLLLIGIALLSVSASSLSATLILKQGESYDYRFSELPFALSVRGGLGAGAGGEVSVTLESGTFDSAGLRIEMFEGADSTIPFFQGVGTPDGATLFHFEGGRWSDKEGKIRLTALQGDFAIISVRVDASVIQLRNGKADIDFYRRDIDPVPEPSAAALILSIGVLSASLFRRRAHCTGIV